MATQTVSSTASSNATYANGVPYKLSEQSNTNPEKHDVQTILNFFKPNEDGSPPAPTYVGRPETYERPVNPNPVTIKDVSGDEDKYTLDSHGFQFHRHTSVEKDFVDEAQIKDQYYKEVDALLKEV